MTKSELALQRLLKAKKYLELALDTRAIAYETVPYVIAASTLINLAILKQDVQDNLS